MKDFGIAMVKPNPHAPPCERCEKPIPDGENVLIFQDNDGKPFLFICERCFIVKSDTFERVAHYLKTGQGREEIDFRKKPDR